MTAHDYTLRRTWRDQDAFDAVLAYIRAHGEVLLFGSWDYLEFVPEGSDYFHWNIDLPRGLKPLGSVAAAGV
jgi:hypothetical protein